MREDELQFYFLGIILLGLTWLLLQVAAVFWLGFFLIWLETLRIGLPVSSDSLSISAFFVHWRVQVNHCGYFWLYFYLLPTYLSYLLHNRSRRITTCSQSVSKAVCLLSPNLKIGNNRFSLGNNRFWRFVLFEEK